jgi:hypothetical protein
LGVHLSVGKRSAGPPSTATTGAPAQARGAASVRSPPGTPIASRDPECSGHAERARCAGCSGRLGCAAVVDRGHAEGAAVACERGPPLVPPARSGRTICVTPHALWATAASDRSATSTRRGRGFLWGARPCRRARPRCRATRAPLPRRPPQLDPQAQAAKRCTPSQALRHRSPG